MLLLSNYFQWPFCAILVTLFSQTLLQPAQANFDEIYKEMHDKLFHFEKVVQQIVQEPEMDSFIKEAFDKREKEYKKVISSNAKISELYETWRNSEIEILDDYLELRQKEVHPSLMENKRTKWKEIIRPLNEHDGKFYSKHELEMIQKEANKHILWKFFEVTKTENAAFFERLASAPETKKIENMYIDLCDYARVMAGIKLLKEQDVVPAQPHDAVQHHLQPAAADSATHKSVDYAKMINIRALASIVKWLYDYLKYRHAKTSAQLLESHYPTFEQRNQILAEANRILEASTEKSHWDSYSAVDNQPFDVAKSRFEHELDTMVQVKRFESAQMSKYFTELVFDEWAKKTKLGTIQSETYDANKSMAETETALEKMKIEEEATSSNTEDLNI